MDGDVVEEQVDVHGLDDFGANAAAPALGLAFDAQLLGSHEVEVAPGSAFGLIAELLEGVGFELALRRGSASSTCRSSTEICRRQGAEGDSRV